VTEAVAGSTIPRRILGVALRTARLRSKKTQKEAAEAIGQSEQTVRRIEQGIVPTAAGKVDNLCQLYREPAQTREALKALARETKSTAQRWWHAYGDVVPTWFEVYVALETMASRERCFDPLLINGLLQDDGYMLQAMLATRPQGAEEIAARVELRLTRQQLLTRPYPAPLRLDAVVAEPVLMLDLPEGVMRNQLWKLLKATELPNVTVRVVPLSAGLHLASSTAPFTLLDFPAEGDSPAAPTTLYSENRTGAIYSEAPAEVANYEQAWMALEAAALDHDQSIDLLSYRMKELVDRER
jgi:transcriptional regulator with XRE-family HTH domain